MLREFIARGNVRIWSLVFVVSLALFGLSASAQSTRYGSDGVTVFTASNYRGTSETFADDVPDLRSFGLNDRIVSIDVPPGETWEVCQDINFENTCQMISNSVANLNSIGWANKISSLRRVDGGYRRGGYNDVYSPRGTTGSQGATLFTDPNYRGTRETVYDDVPDLRTLGLNDMVSSIDIPTGEQWQVCQDINFGGACQILGRSVTNLGSIGWADRISSLRRLDGGYSTRGTSGFAPRIIIYAQPGYRGAARVMETETRNLGQFGRSASSVEIRGGSWELCDRPNGNGRCVTLDRSVPDLSRVGLRGAVVSVRPVDNATDDDYYDYDREGRDWIYRR